MAEWSTVRVVVEPDEVDLVSGLLWSAGVAGVEESTAGVRVELRAGCATDVVGAVRAALDGRWSVDVVAVEADAGLDAWRDHAEAWRAGDRFVIVPPWIEAPEVAPDEIVLSIDPGHAFGSGSHPTTRLCLGALEQLVSSDSVVADIGCGSGVLAIAAALLGAIDVVAIDIDLAAVSATEENAARCGVDHVIDASDSSPADLDRGRFDLVVANIGAGVLRAMAVDLVAVVRPGGVLVLSGVLVEQRDEVLAAFVAAGAEMIAAAETDGWCVIELRRSVDRPITVGS